MDERPWYRHRWPWILMAGPAIVIAAGTATSVVAFTGADGIVADDYYKQGLAINRVLAREARATELGIEASVRLEDGRAVAVIAARGELPDRVRLTLAHPTRSGLDRTAMLARTASGEYVAPLGPLAAGHWRVILEAADWRYTATALARS